MLYPMRENANRRYHGHGRSYELQTWPVSCDGDALCTLYHMPHAPAVGAKLDAVFKAMGFEKDGFAQLGELLTRIGVIARLRDFGFEESHLPTIVKETMNSAQRPTNPREPTPEDIADLVRRMA